MTLERVSRTGYYYPLSPKLLLFMGRGAGKFNSMVYRIAEDKDVMVFNNMICQARQQAIISSEQLWGG